MTRGPREIEDFMGWETHSREIPPPGPAPSRSKCGLSKRTPRTDPGIPAVTAAEAERVFREEYGRAVAVLARAFGDIDVAEEGGSGRSPWQ